MNNSTKSIVAKGVRNIYCTLYFFYNNNKQYKRPPINNVQAHIYGIRSNIM